MLALDLGLRYAWSMNNCNQLVPAVRITYFYMQYQINIDYPSINAEMTCWILGDDCSKIFFEQQIIPTCINLLYFTIDLKSHLQLVSYKAFIQWQSTASNSLFRMDDKNSNVGIQSIPAKCAFYPRIGHKAVRLNENLLVFGGISPSGDFLKTVLRFNLENLKIDQLSNVFFPNLQGFSVFTYRDKLYLWGGNLDNQVICRQLSHRIASGVSKDQTFKFVVRRDRYPVQGLFIVVLQQLINIFQYSGASAIHKFSTNNFVWSRVQTTCELPKNVKYQMIWQNERGFLLSQEQIQRTGFKSSLKIKNQIFQLRMVNFSNFKLRINQIQDSTTTLPSRFNFSLAIIHNQILVMGGETVSKYKSDISQYCNDVWAFNIQTLQWSKKSIALNTKAHFQSVCYKNSVFQICGLYSNNQMSNSIQIINIKNVRQLQTQVCTFCKNIFTLTSHEHMKKPSLSIQLKNSSEIQAQISTNFLSKLARTLQNPIQALGLFVDNCLNMGASLVNISICSPSLSLNYFKQSQNYLYIGDNSKSFSTEEITKIMFSFRVKVERYFRDCIDKQDVKMRNQYGLNLKLSSLRLGNSCLFITSTTDQQIFVAYFSDCQTNCPDGNLSFNCFYYTINKEGKCLNNINRQIIRQNVKHLVGQQQFLNTCLHKTKVYIFGINDISKTFGNGNRSDICYSHPFHGLCLYSLTQYVSCLYLNPFLGRQIFIESSRVVFTNLYSKFKQDEKNGLIVEIDTSPSQLNIFSKISIYRIIKPLYKTNFVFIYHQNRLINTLQSKDKTICGFLQVPEQIQVDFFKSKIERWQEQKKLMSCIESKEESFKRLRRSQNLAPDDQVRKMKPTYLQF